MHLWLLDIHFDVLIYNPKLATTSYFGKAEILRTFSNLFYKYNFMKDILFQSLQGSKNC